MIEIYFITETNKENIKIYSGAETTNCESRETRDIFVHDSSLRVANISVLRIQRTICHRVNSSDARHRIDSFSNGLYRETRHTSGSTPDVWGGDRNSSREYVARNAWIISFARVASTYDTHTFRSASSATAILL